MDPDCTVSASQTLRLLFKLKEVEEEKLLKSAGGHQQQRITDTPTTRDLDTTIRILKQTNLK